MYCPVCLEPIALVLRNGHNDADPMMTGDDAFHRDFRLLRSYPCGPQETAAPEHTPDDVASDYREAMDSLQRKNHNAAGVMFRKTLQRATTAVASLNNIERFKPKVPLQHRIDALARDALLTEGMRELAVAIKLDGNAAAHEEDRDFDAASAVRIQEFTHLFLTYTFTLPVSVRKAREEDEETKKQ